MLAHQVAERLRRRLAALEAQIREATDRAVRESTAETIAEARHLLAELPGLNRVCPDVLFERRLVLQGSWRQAEVLCCGGGHTRRDAFVFLPDDRVALMADLVMAGVMPLAAHGDAREFRRILDEVRALDVERIVPGHGPVGTPDDLERTDAYLAWLIDVVAEHGEAAHGVQVPEPFAGWAHGAAHTVNVEALLAA